jgi:hypothetical protein
MNETPPLGPPAWVRKHDGRLVPFEADKISRALFAATETLGRPDAFLARELADAVVHFLAIEEEGRTATSAAIAELVVKVVRELGQPPLAEAFASWRPPGEPDRTVGDVVLRFAATTPLPEVLSACRRAYALAAVFTRDLAAAQEMGLLTLTGLESPDELAGCVLGPPIPATPRLGQAVEAARRLVGDFVVTDAPEHLLALCGQANAGGADELTEDLLGGLRHTGLRAVVNLNTAAAPSWADALAEGPLFDAPNRPAHPEGLTALAERILDGLRGVQGVRIDWHLGERDFIPPESDYLLRLARHALEGAPLGFVLDRPRRGVALAEGVERQHPAVLLTVGLHLPRLAEQPGVGSDPERFLAKLGSLARLALSAAVQKREYLRRQARQRPESPALTSGFLLDRARLLVAPVGLEAVVVHFTGRGLCAGGTALELGRRIGQRLRDVLRQDGRAAQMQTCLDGPWNFQLGTSEKTSGRWPAAPQVAGLTPWDPAALVKAQLRAAGVLHGTADGGTLALFVPEETTPTAQQAAEWLRTAWHHSEVLRLRFVRGAVPPHHQLQLPGSP